MGVRSLLLLPLLFLLSLIITPKAFAQASIQFSPADIYEDVPITVTVEGCSGPTDFSWWRVDSYDGGQRSCVENHGNNCSLPDGDSFSSQSNSFVKNNFGSDESGEKYTMRAVCRNSQEVAWRDFVVHTEGSEYMLVKGQGTQSLSFFTPGSSFDVVLGGLIENDCYYLVVKDPSGAVVKKEGNSSCRNDDNAYIGSKEWGTNTTVSVDGISTASPTGIYSIYLQKEKGRFDRIKETLVDLAEAGAVYHFIPVLGQVIGGYAAAETIYDHVRNQDDQVLALGVICMSLAESNTEECDPSATPPPPAPPCATELDDSDTTKGCGAVSTAVGSISTDPQELIASIFTLLLSLSGGIVVLLIIRAAYQLMTSQGDPEKVKEARERITSAVIGLLFLIFSFVILEVIGVDILHIPGFS